ncbi:hypothetical protein BH18THE2_BH18THE2_05100 [soil metagenome]
MKIICLTVTNNNVLIYSFLVIVLIFHTPGATNYLGENVLYPSYKTASASTEGGNGANLTNSSGNSSPDLLSSSSDDSANDIFGIKKIYPTKNGGREWFIDMNDPRSDGVFFITSDVNITQQADSSWRINNTNVRLNVDTPPNIEPWKDIEITGYAKIVDQVPIDGNSQANTDDYDLNWLARGGRHSSESPCEGSALTAILDINGTVGWKKEIWFPGGYTDERAREKVTDSLLNRWVGFKAIMYNTNNNTAVKMESYIDNRDTNYWVQVTDLIDNGDWFSKSPDEEFNSADCGRPKNYVLTNSGSIVTFRSDNIVWDFKDLSVREIQVP